MKKFILGLVLVLMSTSAFAEIGIAHLKYGDCSKMTNVSIKYDNGATLIRSKEGLFRFDGIFPIIFGQNFELCKKNINWKQWGEDEYHPYVEYRVCYGIHCELQGTFKR